MLIGTPGTIQNCGVIYSIGGKFINQLSLIFCSEKTVIKRLACTTTKKTIVLANSLSETIDTMVKLFKNIATLYNYRLVMHNILCIAESTLGVNFVQNALEYHLRRTKIQNFPGGMPPDPTSMSCFWQLYSTQKLQL